MAGFVKASGYSKKGTAILGNLSQISSLSIAVGAAIPCFANTIYNDSTSISIVSTTQVKILAGKKYKITGQFAFTQASVTGAAIRMYNRTAGAYMGSMAQVTPANDPGNNTFVNFCEHYLVATVDIIIELHNIVVSTANITILYPGNKLVIEEVENYLV